MEYTKYLQLSDTNTEDVSVFYIDGVVELPCELNVEGSNAVGNVSAELNMDIGDIRAMPFHDCWFEAEKEITRITLGKQYFKRIGGDHLHTYLSVTGIRIKEAPSNTSDDYEVLTRLVLEDSKSGKTRNTSTMVLCVGVDGFRATDKSTQSLSDVLMYNCKMSGNSSDRCITDLCKNVYAFACAMQLGINKLLGNARFAKSNYKAKIKIGSGKNKSHTKISNVVIIKPKNLIDKSGFTLRTAISEFTHGWWVRGHWRVCNGLGNNRSGERVVKGRTWIAAFTKKDELGIIQKTRVLR